MQQNFRADSRISAWSRKATELLAHAADLPTLDLLRFYWWSKLLHSRAQVAGEDRYVTLILLVRRTPS